jgi:hypothetical protein
MKNTHRLFSVVLATAFALQLTSCTKDAIEAPKAPASPETVSGKSHYFESTDIEKIGAIRTVVTTPEYQVSVVAFNDNFKSEQVFADLDGLAFIDRLPPGTYTLIARVHPTEENPKEFDDLVQTVDVQAGKVTDITVEFQ